MLLTWTRLIAPMPPCRIEEPYQIAMPEYKHNFGENNYTHSSLESSVDATDVSGVRRLNIRLKSGKPGENNVFIMFAIAYLNRNGIKCIFLIHSAL